MLNSQKPRHIRDIAHLYLSRAQKPAAAAPTSPALIIAADDASSLSGFHAANLAAGFSAKGLRVRLTEISGLLPNSGYYMLLPPERYIHWRQRPRGPVYSGLNGIRIGFQASGLTGRPSSDGLVEIKMFHLPPIHSGKSFSNGIERIHSAVGDRSMVLLLEAGHRFREETMRLLISSTSRFSPVDLCILRLNVRAPGSYPADFRFFDLGSLPVWAGTVADRVPAILRAPDSVLSRAYQSICESLLSKLNRTRRRSGADRVIHASSGI